MKLCHYYAHKMKEASVPEMGDTSPTNGLLAFMCKYALILKRNILVSCVVKISTNKSVTEIIINLLSVQGVRRNSPFKYLSTQHNSTGISILQKPIFLHQLLSTSNSVA